MLQVSTMIPNNINASKASVVSPNGADLKPLVREAQLFKKMSKKTPIPPKEHLQKLYNEDLKNLREIGLLYGVSIAPVCKWFKAYNIIIKKLGHRNFKGSRNPHWNKKGLITYTGYHLRVSSLRGKPKKCEVCNSEDKNRRYDWANLTGKYDDVSDYKRMCRSCHIKYDCRRKVITTHIVDDSEIKMLVCTEPNRKEAQKKYYILKREIILKRQKIYYQQKQNTLH